MRGGSSLILKVVQYTSSAFSSCKAVFVDTDLVPGKESHVGDLVQNEVEARLVYHVRAFELVSKCALITRLGHRGLAAVRHRPEPNRHHLPLPPAN